MSKVLELSKQSDNDIAYGLMQYGEKTLAEVVPINITAIAAIENIRRSVAGLKNLGRATSIVGAYLGRHLAVVASRPDILEIMGYGSIGDLVKAEIEDKLGVGTVYNYKLICETFPELPIDQIVSIGSTNLLKAAKVCKDKSDSQKQTILEHAHQDTKGFTKWIEEESGFSGAGETTSASFQLIGTKAQVDELKEWLAMQEMQSWAGTDHPLSLVLAAIQSTVAEWQQPNAKKRA